LRIKQLKKGLENKAIKKGLENKASKLNDLRLKPLIIGHEIKAIKERT